MSWTDKSREREYNHAYYLKHANELNERKRKRYQSDPKYRKSILEAKRNREKRQGK